MLINRVVTQGKNRDEIYTEIMFALATARTEGAELLFVEITECDVEKFDAIKSSVIKRLKQMKQSGQIQFFATPDSFKRASTEAVFLLNKYSTFLGNVGEMPEGQIVIKI